MVHTSLVRTLCPRLEQEPNLPTLPDYKTLNYAWSLMDCLPTLAHQTVAVKITISTITVHERAAKVINSTTLGPRVAVELEPNVCVVNQRHY